MRLRLVSIDELQYLTCLKYGIWGSKSARFKDWKAGDYLGFIVDKAIAGLAEVAGDPYVSKDQVWDNGVYPYRIPLKFVHAREREKRLPILGRIRDTLTSVWGTVYGWGIRNQQLLEGEGAETIVGIVRTQENDLPSIEAKLEGLIEEAKLARAAKAAPGPKRKRRRAEKIELTDSDAVATEQEESEHLKAQYCLIRLGKVTGCSVWIASNDRNRLYQGKELCVDCLSSLPNLGLSAEATKRISYIDAIWVRQNAPLCAFEVETTTSVYSGILRMSDLLALVPAINIKLFIVAPRDRENKVKDELVRPTFQKIGLSEYCRFIAIEDLHALLQRVEDLEGYVQPDVLNRIAEEPEAETLGGVNSYSHQLS